LDLELDHCGGTSCEGKKYTAGNTPLASALASRVVALALRVLVLDLGLGLEGHGLGLGLGLAILS